MGSSRVLVVGVSELLPSNPVCIGTTKVLVYSNNSVGEGAQEDACNWCWEEVDQDQVQDHCKGVVVMGPGHVFLRLVACPITWSSVRLALHCACSVHRVALKEVISSAVSSQAFARMEAIWSWIF